MLRRNISERLLTLGKPKNADLSTGARFLLQRNRYQGAAPAGALQGRIYLAYRARIAG